MDLEKFGSQKTRISLLKKVIRLGAIFSWARISTIHRNKIRDWKTPLSWYKVLVRFGQGKFITTNDFRIWARSVCMNDSLELGSMLPLIAKAVERKMSVIVFNPNLSQVKGVSKCLLISNRSSSLIAKRWILTPDSYGNIMWALPNSIGSSLLPTQQEEGVSHLFRSPSKKSFTRGSTRWPSQTHGLSMGGFWLLTRRNG